MRRGEGRVRAEAVDILYVCCCDLAVQRGEQQQLQYYGMFYGDNFVRSEIRKTQLVMLRGHKSSPSDVDPLLQQETVLIINYCLKDPVGLWHFLETFPQSRADNDNSASINYIIIATPYILLPTSSAAFLLPAPSLRCRCRTNANTLCFIINVPYSKLSHFTRSGLSILFNNALKNSSSLNAPRLHPLPLHPSFCQLSHLMLNSVVYTTYFTTSLWEI